MTSPDMLMAGSYDYRLVVLSVLISVLAAYAARNLAGRVAAAKYGARTYWLIGGAAASGIGTWSMHYTGMLAFKLPAPVGYHWPTVLLSFLPAFFSSAVALWVVSRPTLGFLPAVAGGALMGGGISALHYTAMGAMRLPAICLYSPALVALSVIFAVVISVLALRLAFPVRGEPGGRWREAACIVAWGASSPAMHYTGMAAASFTSSAVVPDLSHTLSISSIGVAGISIVPMMVLGVALSTSLADRFQKQREQLRALAGRLKDVREEEKTRVAREIHDELGQALTAIKIALSSLTHDLPAARKQESGAILGMVDETIQAVRRISTELRPAILDVGLVAAIEWAAEEFEARTGIKCRLELPADDIVIDPERATALFRIFQETLTNVARHANATEVNARLAQEDGSLSLEVHDNGKGISEEEVSASTALGILGMRERALLLGGKLTINGAPGRGTTMTVEIPENHPAPAGVSK